MKREIERHREEKQMCSREIRKSNIGNGSKNKRIVAFYLLD